MKGYFSKPFQRTMKIKETFIRYVPFAGPETGQPQALYAKTPDYGRASHTGPKCRTEFGRAKKRRGDHDTSVERRPGENRGEAGTYGAENHRPPDEIPTEEPYGAFSDSGVCVAKYGMSI